MIEIRNITKSYDSLQVLKGINLDIVPGEIVSIVGPSGAGKTTLLQIIGSLDRPNSGTVKYDNTDIFSLKDAQLARFRNQNIGFVFQFHQLLPEFTLLENVAMPALIPPWISDDKLSPTIMAFAGLKSGIRWKQPMK